MCSQYLPSHATFPEWLKKDANQPSHAKNQKTKGRISPPMLTVVKQKNNIEDQVYRSPVNDGPTGYLAATGILIGTRFASAVSVNNSSSIFSLVVWVSSSTSAAVRPLVEMGSITFSKLATRPESDLLPGSPDVEEVIKRPEPAAQS
jgi:hypothetical protein